MVVPTQLGRQIDEIITHYPSQYKRAAVLWLLHLLQEHFGCIGKEQVEWTAVKLDLQPINVWELVSFYPMFTNKPHGKFHIKVCRTLSCELGGCRGILDHLQKKLGVGLEETTADGLFMISTVECLASCGTGPVMMVNDELFESLTPEKVDTIIDGIKQTGKLDSRPLPPVQPAHPLEKRILLANASRPGYTGLIADYEGVGGYQTFRQALVIKPEDIVNEVKESKLRGRGGAGFPTGLKWQFLDRKSGKPIYLICNADESEPGTFKDRQLIHYDPHQLLEGMLISCYAVGAHTAYIYIRGEMALGAKILLRAIEEARARNYLGRNILGKGFDCEIYVHRGAGAYICGEETGLIESLEGKRSYPRIKPPFPAVCVSGPVKRPGYYEFEMGKLTMRQLIYDLCGGLKDGRTLKGVVPGGSSMPVLKADQIDVPLDFDSLVKAGTMAGSGGVIVLDDATDIVDTTFNVSKFYAHESCGQCTPCREGTLWMEKMLHRIHAGHGCTQDVDLLYDIADNIDGKTICPLGEAVAWPVKAFVTKYRQEFEEACRKNGNGSSHK